MSSEAITGTGLVYSPMYYQRVADYQKLLNECRGICQHEIQCNRAPDDRVLLSTRLEFVIDEIKSVVTRLETMTGGDY